MYVGFKINVWCIVLILQVLLYFNTIWLNRDWMMNIYKLVEYRLVDYRYHNELEWVSLRDLDFPQWNRFMPNFISSSSETIKSALCY